jgi:acyl carrier protein
MVPSIFVFLEMLPLTPNGKVDRNALPQPDILRPALTQRYAAPETEIEKAIATIWQEVLGLDRVGRHDNFFDLGGHSLRMVQVYSRLKAQIERDFPMVKLFEYPTVAAIARFLGQDYYVASDRPSLNAQIRNRAVRQKMVRTKQRQEREIRKTSE